MKPMPGSVPSSVRKRFPDNFGRPNTAEGLDRSADGSLWNNVRGLFRIQNNRAAAISAPEQFPIASVNMPTIENTIELGDMGNGTGAAIWITDAGNWWAVGIDQESVDCNCETCSDCTRWNSLQCVQRNASTCINNGCTNWNVNNCTAFACSSWNSSNCAGSFNSGNCSSFNSTNCRTFNSSNCNSFNSQNCSTWTFCGTADRPRFCCNAWNSGGNCNSANSWNSGGNCSAFNSTSCRAWNSGNCNSFNSRTCATNTCAQFSGSTCTTWTCVSWQLGSCIAFAEQTCNTWVQFDCNCETCFPQYIRVFQSIGSTVSTVLSSLIPGTLATSVTRIIRSIRVRTTGDSISVEQFANSDLTDKITSDLLYQPTGAEVTTEYGIIVRPSAHNPNYSVGSIDITRSQ